MWLCRSRESQQGPSQTSLLYLQGSCEDLKAPGPRPQDNRGQMLFMLCPGAKELSLVEPCAGQIWAEGI